MYVPQNYVSESSIIKNEVWKVYLFNTLKNAYQDFLGKYHYSFTTE